MSNAKKGNTEFKARLNNAAAILRAGLKLDNPTNLDLVSPVWKEGSYEWIVVMKSDGTLFCERLVRDGEPKRPEHPINLLIGVILQSEWTTGETKPNPFGKAMLSAFPHGIWVDVKGKGRRRLDRVFVLFVVPKPSSNQATVQKTYRTVTRNVDNATYAIEDTDVVHVARGDKATSIANQIELKVRKWLKGKGRPYKRP